ncbi:MAG: hypothetical protein SGARI_004764, partial [Bacillariaceae sp.]
MAVVTDFAFQYPIEIRIKLLIYMLWVATEDIETQRKGLVVINMPNRDVPLLPERKEHVLGQQAMEAIPIRICALHMCLPNEITFRLLKANVAFILGKDQRKRIKIHLGERTELHYSLHGYGIYVDQIPVTETGNVKMNNLHQWIKIRRAIEGKQMSAKGGISNNPPPIIQDKDNIIESPAINDVIFRLGKSYLFHPGNLMFRNLIEEVFEAHNSAESQEEKVNITWSVIDKVLIEKKGRFLGWDSRGGWWIEMKDRSQIRTKVAVHIREFKKR